MHNRNMDGLMTFDVMSFSTVFQSYQDDARVIMKRLLAVEGRVWLERFLSQAELEPGAARSVGQGLTH